MKHTLICLLLSLFISKVGAQVYHTDDIQPDTLFENVFSKRLFSDSLTSSFIIWIKQEVPLHKHAEHTEQVYILEGTANMLLGDNWIAIKSGDYIVIPKGTPHQVIVNSAVPLKVLSIQSPMFDGTDRILISN